MRKARAKTEAAKKRWIRGKLGGSRFVSTCFGSPGGGGGGKSNGPNVN